MLEVVAEDSGSEPVFQPARKAGEMEQIQAITLHREIITVAVAVVGHSRTARLVTAIKELLSFGISHHSLISRGAQSPILADTPSTHSHQTELSHHYEKLRPRRPSILPVPARRLSDRPDVEHGHAALRQMQGPSQAMEHLRLVPNVAFVGDYGNSPLLVDL